MKLISDFSDYYDSILMLDEDYDTKFIRKSVDVNDDDLSKEFSHDVIRNLRTGDLYKTKNKWIVVKFIKNLYFGVIQKDIEEDKETVIWFSIKNAQSFFKQSRKRYWSDTNEEFDVNYFETVVKPKYNFLKEKFNDVAYCVFYVNEFDCRYKKSKYSFQTNVNVTSVTKYPRLKDFNFYNVVDPYTLYQELSMWIDNNACNNDPVMPVGTDEELAEAKGFDRKFSFRKEKKKK